MKPRLMRSTPRDQSPRLVAKAVASAVASAVAGAVASPVVARNHCFTTVVSHAASLVATSIGGHKKWPHSFGQDPCMPRN